MKKNLKKIVSVLAILVMVLGIFTMVSCGDKEEESDAELSGWDYIEGKGTLVVGLDDTFAPMGFRDNDGKLVGFDIDLATAVAEELGLKVEFQPINWDAKEMELKSKNIDCIWNGLSVTDERKEAFALTDMYLNNCNIIMTIDKKINIKSEKELKNYKIGTQIDSSALKVMQQSKLWDEYSDNVTEYPTFDEAILDMKSGRVDAIVVDQVLGEYKNANLKADEKMTICDFNFGDDFYAIACRKADTDVAEKINEAIQANIDNGKAEEISNKWFGKNIVILKGYDK